MELWQKIVLFSIVTGILFILLAEKAKALPWLVKKWEFKRGIPGGLLSAIAKVESENNPDAIGKDGEIGLCQILPSTAGDMGWTEGEGSLFDPNINLKYASAYLIYQFKRYSSWYSAISAYNAGHYMIENSDYVDKVKALWEGK